jgi:hypothetical protein
MQYSTVSICNYKPLLQTISFVFTKNRKPYRMFRFTLSITKEMVCVLVCAIFTHIPLNLRQRSPSKTAQKSLLNAWFSRLLHLFNILLYCLHCPRKYPLNAFKLKRNVQANQNRPIFTFNLLIFRPFYVFSVWTFRFTAHSYPSTRPCCGCLSMKVIILTKTNW